MLTQLEAVEELLKPYIDDPSLRSVDDLGTCLYRGPDGKMCVFARACTEEGRLKLKEQKPARVEIERLGKDIIQEKYRHLPIILFGDMQGVHDTNSHSLSEWLYEKLIQKIKDGYYG